MKKWKRDERSGARRKFVDGAWRIRGTNEHVTTRAAGPFIAGSKRGRGHI